MYYCLLPLLSLFMLQGMHVTERICVKTMDEVDIEISSDNYQEMRWLQKINKQQNWVSPIVLSSISSDELKSVIAGINALRNKNFLVYYQNIADSKRDGRMLGAELVTLLNAAGKMCMGKITSSIIRHMLPDEMQQIINSFLYETQCFNNFVINKNFEQLPCAENIKILTSSLSGSTVASVSETVAIIEKEQRLCIWNTCPWQIDKELYRTKKCINCVSYSPFGDVIAIGLESDKDNLQVYSLADGKLKNNLAGHDSSILHIIYSPDGKYCATTAKMKKNAKINSIFVWDLETGTIKHDLACHKEQIEAIAWSPMGDTIASCCRGDEGNFVIWDCESGKVKYLLSVEKFDLFNVVYSPNGEDIAITGSRVWNDGNVRSSLFFYSVKTGKQKYETSPPVVHICHISYDNSGDCIIVAGDTVDSGVVLINSDSGQIKKKLRCFEEVMVKAVQKSPNGMYLAVGNRLSNNVLVYDIHTGELHYNLNAHGAEVGALAYVPGMASLISGSDKKEDRPSLIKWNLDPKEKLTTDGAYLLFLLQKKSENIKEGNLNHALYENLSPLVKEFVDCNYKKKIMR